MHGLYRRDVTAGPGRCVVSVYDAAAVIRRALAVRPLSGAGFAWLSLFLVASLFVPVYAQQPAPELVKPSSLQPPPLKRWLQDAGAPGVSVGVDVRRVDNAQTLTRVAADSAMNPASTIKLLTAWTALGVLGPDYRWRTRFYLAGPITNGALNGDLLIYGGGDPKLVVEDLTELILQLRAAGLTDIDGDLLLDDSLYALPDKRGPAFDGLNSEPYNVRPTSVMMNFKSTKFTLTPRAGKVVVELDPPLAGIKIDNRLRLVKGRCRHRASGIGITEVGREHQPVVRLDGKYSTGCRRQSSFHAVLKPSPVYRRFLSRGLGGSRRPL